MKRITTTLITATALFATTLSSGSAQNKHLVASPQKPLLVAALKVPSQKEGTVSTTAKTAEQSASGKENIIITEKRVTHPKFAGSADSSAIPDETILKNIHLTTLTSYAEFKKTVGPLVDKMGVKKIVGLGEGTHGTAEFYKLRYWITRMLVEEKGFNHVAFENDFSNCWFLNKELSAAADLNMLMKKYMLSIWQNEEVKELLTWIKDYNSKHTQKVVVDGIDYVMLSSDVDMLKAVLGKSAATEALNKPIQTVMQAAALQDAAWEATNHKDAKQTSWETLKKSGHAAYLVTQELEKSIAQMKLSAAVKQNSMLALNNLKQGFAVFYTMITKTTEVSRDSCMALTAAMLLTKPADKMVIWAHNAHLAKTAVYGGAVGGTGGHLLNIYPNNYFVLGTGTAGGTFAATTEPRDTNNNPMLPYNLDTPIIGSWEELLSQTGKDAFYFDPAEINRGKTVKPLRFVGYSPKSGATTYDKTNISNLFDVYLFIKDTHAGTPLKLPVTPQSGR